MNKPRKITEQALEDIYTGCKLMLTKQKAVSGPALRAELFPERSYSWVATGLSELNRLGHIRQVGIEALRKIYCLTNKEFIAKPKQSVCTRQEGRFDHKTPPQTSRPLFTPDNPAEPGGWITDLNKVIAGLELLQAAIPGLKVGLLDLTKNLERLEKVKEIVGDVAKAARRNV